MRLRTLLLYFACSICLAQQVATRDLEIVPVGRRMALVVGNSNYTLGKLKNPVNDAVAMEGTLKKLGFEVTSLKDASFKQMRQALNAFADRLQKGDLAFFYYAGHGIQIKERNYLVPVDFTGESMTDAEYETLAADQVRQRLEESPASVRILVLDACRNNPFPAVSRSAVRGLREMERAEGTLVAFATGANNVADDNSADTNGLYTKYLMAALETPGLTHVEVFKRVQAEVKRGSPGGKQNPAYYDNIIGMVVLNESGKKVVTAVPGGGDNYEEEVFWKECQEKKGAFCDVYLKKFENGRFVELAKLYVKPAPVGEVAPGRKQGPGGLMYVWVPPGSFTMGCVAGDKDCFEDEVKKPVTFAKGFWMGETEVTQGHFEKAVGANPSHFRGPRRPVERVGWRGANAFCTVGGGRLPSEQEWEYAARAGSTEIGYGPPGQVAWFEANSEGKTHVAGTKQPNKWGLYDMLGNVWEWTSSNYDAETKVVRGGGWNRDVRGLRASLRHFHVRPTLTTNAIGFRCVRDTL